MKDKPAVKDVQMESPKRKYGGPMATVVTMCGVALSLFTIYILGFKPVDPLVARSTFLFFSSVLAFFLWPAGSKGGKDRLQVIDVVLIILSAAVWIYTLLDYSGITERAGVSPSTADVVLGVVLVIASLEMARRTMGPALPVLGALMVVYAILGKYMPGMFRHPGFSLERTISYIYSSDGIYGVPLAVTVTYVFVFVLFGAFMEATGGGKVLMDLSMAIAGRARGGAAKIAIVASSFFGSINGSPVANVTATGTFTIPLMKKTGYKPAFAGAVEAVASTGGQILPPVMGAAVFIMVELVRIPYGQIALAASIPAILYYLAVFWMVDLEAQKHGLHGLPKEQVPHMKKVLAGGGHLLIPIAVLIYTLIVAQMSPLRAGLWGVVSCFAVSFLSKDTRLSLSKIIGALKSASEGTVMVTAAVAVAGAIVGIFGLTGLGLNMANILLGYSGGYLILTMFLSMIVLLILGVGMPTTGSYIIGATIIAPALIKLGVLPLAAHLFVLYFANISNITPPVALAAYAGAGIAGASPMDVGVRAFKLGMAGFIIPYMMIFGNELMLVGTVPEVILATITATVGILSLGAAIQGYFKGELCAWMRLILVTVALLLIKPGLATDLAGFALLAGVLLATSLRNKTAAAEATDSAAD